MVVHFLFANDFYCVTFVYVVENLFLVVSLHFVSLNFEKHDR